MTVLAPPPGYLSIQLGEDPLGIAPRARRLSRAAAISPADYGWIEIAVPLGMPTPFVPSHRTLGSGEPTYLLHGWSIGGGQGGHVEKWLVHEAAKFVPVGAPPAGTGGRVLGIYSERRPCEAGANPCGALLRAALHPTTPVLWSFDETDLVQWLAMRHYQRRALVDAWVATARQNVAGAHGVPTGLVNAINRFQFEIDEVTTQFLMQGQDLMWIDAWIDGIYLPHASEAIRSLFGL
jgi:hypothetical protein